MVLLTSSAISVAISGGVVCMFTFLLFLSGYVLQQQTVRALQDALRNPPPRVLPTLPAAFQQQDSGSDHVFPQLRDHVVVMDSEELKEDLRLETIINLRKNERILVSTNDETLPQHENENQLSNAVPSPTTRIAYMLSIPHPTTLCSALLFTKVQREKTHLLQRPAVIYLYPASWETATSPTEVAALKLLRDFQERLDITLHPVAMSSVWKDVSVQTQLLGEMQVKRWDYDRIMYLKSSGLPLDMTKLDNALFFSNMKTSWTSISGVGGQDPDMLLISNTKGLMTPRSSLRQLIASAATRHSDHHESEIELEAMANDAAYVLFDDAEIEHRMDEKTWFGGLFERFEREREAICQGSGILENREEQFDLRTKSRLLR